MKAATPTKLRNGSWGARVSGTAGKGETICITTRSGKTWNAKVAAVIWTGNGVSIVATVSTGGPSRSSSSTSRRRDPNYCYGPCPVRGHICSPKNGPCHDCE